MKTRTTFPKIQNSKRLPSRLNNLLIIMFYNIVEVVLSAEEVQAVGYIVREFQPTACIPSANIMLWASFTLNRIFLT